VELAVLEALHVHRVSGGRVSEQASGDMK
jgi:hypothetical protein